MGERSQQRSRGWAKRTPSDRRQADDRFAGAGPILRAAALRVRSGQDLALRLAFEA